MEVINVCYMLPKYFLHFEAEKNTPRTNGFMIDVQHVIDCSQRRLKQIINPFVQLEERKDVFIIDILHSLGPTMIQSKGKNRQSRCAIRRKNNGMKIDNVFAMKFERSLHTINLHNCIPLNVS